MKRVFYFFIIIFFASCAKDKGGKLVCEMTYNLSNEKSARIISYSASDERYTKFGDYITSITPSRFIVKFLSLRLQNTWDNQKNNLDIIDNDLDWASTDRIADFSNNSTVNFMLKNVNLSENVTMNYLDVITMFFYQEFELPEQYFSFNIDSGINNLTFLTFGSKNIDYPTSNGENIGGTKEGCLVKGIDRPFMAPIFDDNWTGYGGNPPKMSQNYIFGNNSVQND